MAAATMTSRVLGMVREMVYAGFMGNTWVASAFTLAFQVPNLFRRLLGEGALTAAFIPIFKHKEVAEGEVEMWRSANAVISGLVSAAAVVTLLGVLGISITLAVGKGSFSAQTDLMLRLLRLMFPYMLLVCLAAVLIGMANARGHFFVPALGAAILNVVMIASVLFLAPRLGRTLQEQIFALAIGVVLAGLAQAFFQLPSLEREGFRYRWVSPWRDPTVREVVAKMLPGSIGVAAFQINVLVISLFSFWFEPTIVATFNYSVRLMELPQGMFGISLATYLLPTLSGLAAAKRFPEFRQTLSQGLGYLAFANLIAAAISLAVAVPIVRLIFEHGKFGPDATRRVALALGCLAPGLLMFSMVNILARAFYALNDIKTPMKISLFCLFLNLAFAVCLVQPYREAVEQLKTVQRKHIAPVDHLMEELYARYGNNEPILTDEDKGVTKIRNGDTVIVKRSLIDGILQHTSSAIQDLAVINADFVGDMHRRMVDRASSQEEACSDLAKRMIQFGEDYITAED